MNLFSTKVTYNKVFWKELLIGALEGLAWFVVIGLLVYEFSDGIIELLQYMNDNFDTVLPIFFGLLPVFIIIGVVFKLSAFIIKYNVVDGKTVAAKRPATAKVATKKAATTKRTTTAKKKTTSKK